MNLANDEDETRGSLEVRGIALLLTLGATLFVPLSLALVAVVPVVLDALPFGPLGTVLTEIVRWVALAAVVMVALAVVYRVAPDRDAPRFAWASANRLPPPHCGSSEACCSAGADADGRTRRCCRRRDRPSVTIRPSTWVRPTGFAQRAARLPAT